MSHHGHHWDTALAEPGCEIGGDVLAVDGGYAGSDDRRGAQRHLIDLGTSERPERQWRNAGRMTAQIDTVERCERQCRPLLVTGCDQLATQSVDAVEIFCSAVDIAVCLGVTASSAQTAPRSTRSAASTAVSQCQTAPGEKRSRWLLTTTKCSHQPPSVTGVGRPYNEVQ
jgi:hypothetical protein